MKSTVRDDNVLPAGFKAAGVRAGIKRRTAKDMALLVSDLPATVAGVFTSNRVAAAPVHLCRERVRGGTACAVIVNSGNANACTGKAGMADAKKMAGFAAKGLGVKAETVFVCSTGHIGVRLPMDVIERGVEKLLGELSERGGRNAAEAIMTTDVRPKYRTVRLRIDGKPVTISGLAKGSGMIEPNMATMLCFLMTDAAVERKALQTALKEAVDQSFNRITVDGDESTNDTVLFMANGAAGNRPLNRKHPDWAKFTAALHGIALELALAIVGDGEGATKIITVQVRGAADDRDADRAARAIANSFLVKTSWAGKRPNWGRIMDAVGYSGARVDPEKVDIFFGEIQATRNGVAAGADIEDLKSVIAGDEFTITVDLDLGEGAAVIYTCEITEEYVRINVK